jgi:hypothetical protein
MPGLARPSPDPPPRHNIGLITACCPCRASIVAAASALAEATITCQACDGTF